MADPYRSCDASSIFPHVWGLNGDNAPNWTGSSSDAATYAIDITTSN